MENELQMFLHQGLNPQPLDNKANSVPVRYADGFDLKTAPKKALASLWHPWTKVAAKHIRCIWQSCRAALQGSCRNWKYVCSKMNKQMHILTHMLMLMLLNFSPLFVFLLGLGRLPVVFCQVVHRSMYFCVVRAFVPLFFTLGHFTIKRLINFSKSILFVCLIWGLSSWV